MNKFFAISFWKLACKFYFTLDIDPSLLVLQHCKLQIFKLHWLQFLLWLDWNSVWKWNKSVTMQFNEKWIRSTNLTPYHWDFQKSLNGNWLPKASITVLPTELKCYLKSGKISSSWLKSLSNFTPTHNKWSNMADYVQEL